MLPAGTPRVRSLTLFAAFTGLLVFACVAGRALAQPPPDDTCSGATRLTGPVAGDLTPYHNDYDPGESGCTGHPAPGKDQVFFYDLLCSQGISLTYQPIDFDGSIYVVTDCSDIANTCLAGGDENGVGGVEYADAYPGLATRVYIILDAHDPDAGGAYTLDYNIIHFDPPIGACCFPDGHCELLMQLLCINSGGISYPCEPCTEDLCAPSPVDQRSWGRIKAIYR